MYNSREISWVEIRINCSNIKCRVVAKINEVEEWRLGCTGTRLRPFLRRPKSRSLFGMFQWYCYTESVPQVIVLGCEFSLLYLEAPVGPLSFAVDKWSSIECEGFVGHLGCWPWVTRKCTYENFCHHQKEKGGGIGGGIGGYWVCFGWESLWDTSDVLQIGCKWLQIVSFGGFVWHALKGTLKKLETDDGGDDQSYLHQASIGKCQCSPVEDRCLSDHRLV